MTSGACESPRGAGRATRIALAAGLAVASVGAVVYSRAVGLSARRFASEPGLAVANDSRELIDILTERAGHGRRLVYMSSYLHFVSIDLELEVAQLGFEFPLPPFHLLDGYLRRLDHTNFLWVAVQAGIAREVVHLLPEREYPRRVEVARGSPGVSIEGARMLTHELGTPRTVAVRASRAEPVVLGIDASYLRDATTAELLAIVGDGGLRPDLIVVNLARDNPDVSELARRQLSAAARSLEGLTR